MLTRAAVLAAFALLAAAPATAQSPRDCGRCHDNREFLERVATGRVLRSSLVVTRAHLAQGPHARVACADCHQGVQDYPHDSTAAVAITCQRCHAEQQVAWQRGVHGPHGDSSRATCMDCHRGHDIGQSGFPPTEAGREQMRAVCVRCHAEPVRTALTDVHAQWIPCTACHGAHDARPVPDAATRFIDVTLARACGACHTREYASWQGDIHGRTARRQAAGEQPIVGVPAATCVSCHGEHGIRHATDQSWRFAVADACIGCHEEAGITFRDSYHGQASRVGSTKAAECADCHTAHHVLPASDTASSVADAHRVDTCRQCHETAQPNFIGYQPHVDPTDPAGNRLVFGAWAFMTSALFGTMVLWGLHTLLWYRRLRREKLAHPPAAPSGQPLDSALRGHGPFVWRFSVIFRIVHAMIVLTFFALVVTGLPLRFSCAAWAPGLMGLLGSVGGAGLIHRVAGTLVFVYFAVYFGYVAVRLARSGRRLPMLFGPDAILFNLQDVRDAVANVKWFLGRGPAPRFGRYNYMEKFDFFAELWGVGVIGFSGLMMWQPEFFSRFFPGILFNVALVIHSYEAMIATAFIFTIHFFNVHLRPHKFPLDAVMLHGRATMEYMEEEHPRLAERLRPALEGQAPNPRAVTDAVAPPPPVWLSRFAAVTGMALLGVGLVLIGLILWGSLC